MKKAQNPLIKYERELVNILFQNSTITFTPIKKKLDYKEIKKELSLLIRDLKEKNNFKV